LGIHLVPGDLTPEEQALGAELLAAKYGTDEWNLGTPQAYGVTVSARAKGGTLSLSADVDDRTIRQARIRGDLLVSDRTVLEQLERALAGCPLEGAQSVVQAARLPPDVQEALFRLLLEVGQTQEPHPTPIEENG
jgi:hypothetical protein